MASIVVRYHKTPVGELVVGSFKDELCLADWRFRKMRNAIDKRLMRSLQAEYSEGSSKVIDQTILQLDEYFRRERSQFDIPVRLVGTEFQQKVWGELLKIPFGQTATYMSLSKKVGDEKAIRAVASANGANAISIIVPCHRIIGSDGELVGYAGGLSAKKKLLQLEGALAHNQLEIIF